jgi:hypothetical protein
MSIRKKKKYQLQRWQANKKEQSTIKTVTRAIAEETEEDSSANTCCKWRTHILKDELFSKETITRLINRLKKKK